MFAEQDLAEPDSRRVLIASRTAPTYAGGLANYAFGLAEEIKKRPGCAATFAAMEPGLVGMKPVRELPEGCWLPAAGFHEPRGIWTRLASRPRFHFPLQHWCARSPGLEQRAKPRPAAVHFVGTGWDFFGFAAHRAAKKWGARFTVWPAVHPGQLGDDEIDFRLYRLADAVFHQSERERERLLEGGVAARKLVSCGLPPMNAEPGDGERLRARLGLGRRPIVLFLGRRSVDKGYVALLEAWPMVRAAVPDAVLLVAGPGGNGPVPAAEGEGIYDLGLADESTKADAFAACDVFALPSMHESFGIVYVEAWSYGKPVICGPAPASRELVRAGETGLWVDQTSQSISDGTVRLLCDANLRYSLGEAGRKLQGQRFTWEATLKNHRKAWGWG